MNGASPSEAGEGTWSLHTSHQIFIESHSINVQNQLKFNCWEKWIPFCLVSPYHLIKVLNKQNIKHDSNNFKVWINLLRLAIYLLFYVLSHCCLRVTVYCACFQFLVFNILVNSVATYWRGSCVQRFYKRQIMWLFERFWNHTTFDIWLAGAVVDASWIMTF